METLAMNKSKRYIVMGACFPASILFSRLFQRRLSCGFLCASLFMCWEVGRWELVCVCDVSTSAEMDVCVRVCVSPRAS